MADTQHWNVTYLFNVTPQLINPADIPEAVLKPIKFRDLPDHTRAQIMDARLQERLVDLIRFELVPQVRIHEPWAPFPSAPCTSHQRLFPPPEISREPLNAWSRHNQILRLDSYKSEKFKKLDQEMEKRSRTNQSAGGQEGAQIRGQTVAVARPILNPCRQAPRRLQGVVVNGDGKNTNLQRRKSSMQRQNQQAKQASKPAVAQRTKVASALDSSGIESSPDSVAVASVSSSLAKLPWPLAKAKRQQRAELEAACEAPLPTNSTTPSDYGSLSSSTTSSLPASEHPQTPSALPSSAVTQILISRRTPPVATPGTSLLSAAFHSLRGRPAIVSTSPASVVTQIHLPLDNPNNIDLEGGSYSCKPHSESYMDRIPKILSESQRMKPPATPSSVILVAEKRAVSSIPTPPDSGEQKSLVSVVSQASHSPEQCVYTPSSSLDSQSADVAGAEKEAKEVSYVPWQPEMWEWPEDCPKLDGHQPMDEDHKRQAPKDLEHGDIDKENGALATAGPPRSSISSPSTSNSTSLSISETGPQCITAVQESTMKLERIDSVISADSLQTVTTAPLAETPVVIRNFASFYLPTLRPRSNGIDVARFNSSGYPRWKDMHWIPGSDGGVRRARRAVRSSKYGSC